MDLGSVFIISALLLMTVFFILRPFSEPVSENKPDNAGFIHLMEKQERILKDIRDLDSEFSLGKIPADEYPKIRDQLLHQGADILRQIDEFRNNHDANPSGLKGELEEVQSGASPDPLFDTLETKIADRRRLKQEKATGFCPRCGSPISKSDVYCWKCGQKID